MSEKPVNKKWGSCPTCRKNSAWDASNPWRPFCSERCRMVDLGNWFEERNRLAEPDYLSSENDT